MNALPVSCLTAALLALFFAVPVARCQPHANVAEAISDLPGVILWHLKVFHFLPKNWEAFNQEIEQKRAALQPGETKSFDVLMRTVNREPLVFHGLIEAGKPFLGENLVVVSTINVSRARYVLASRLEPFKEPDFLRFKAAAGAPASHVTYEDHVFTMSALNALNTLSGTRGTSFVDLLDRTARSGADGTVILTATGDATDYSVFDIDLGRTSQHPKGQHLKKMGNTVWLHSRLADGREYVLVYSHLNQFEAVAGKKVKVSSELGQFADPQERLAAVEIWKVQGTQQRFLRSGAKRVFPLTSSSNP